MLLCFALLCCRAQYGQRFFDVIVRPSKVERDLFRERNIRYVLCTTIKRVREARDRARNGAFLNVPSASGAYVDLG